MTHGSLFSGIGGFDLAAEWTGFENLFHCESNEFCQQVLKYHFPQAHSYDDITQTDFTSWRGKITILTGGFPCQPFSVAGQRRGAADDRYLWPEMFRAIREICPSWIIGENVAGIASMVLPGDEIKVGSYQDVAGESYRAIDLREQFVADRICSDLETEGYTVQPLVIPACAVGAPHRRDRIWFIAHRTDTRTEAMQCTGKNGICQPIPFTDSDTGGCREREDEQERFTRGGGASGGCVMCEDGVVADTDGKRCDDWGNYRGEGHVYPYREWKPSENQSKRDEREYRTGKDGEDASNADSNRGGQVQQDIQPWQPKRSKPDGSGDQWICADPNCQQLENPMYPWGRRSKLTDACLPNVWEKFPTQSPVCGRDDGLPFPVDDLAVSYTRWRKESIKAYGNAIVPQVAYEIFKTIKAIEEAE